MSDGALSIAAQPVVGTSGIAGDIRIAESYGGDQSSQIELTPTQLSGGQWVGPAVRARNAGQDTYLGIYFWNSGSPQLRLYKRIAGTWTQLGNSVDTAPLPAGTTLTVTATGSTIRFAGWRPPHHRDRHQPHRRRARDHDLRPGPGRQLERQRHDRDRRHRQRRASASPIGAPTRTASRRTTSPPPTTATAAGAEGARANAPGRGRASQLPLRAPGRGGARAATYGDGLDTLRSPRRRRISTT